MFRIIKKWYFKIYHLFKLLSIFILVFGIKENVFAETFTPPKIECSKTNNIFNEVWNKGYRANYRTVGQPLEITTRNYSAISDYIKVDENTNYILTSDYNTNFYNTMFFLVDENMNYLRTIQITNIQSFMFNTGTNTKYILFYMFYRQDFNTEDYYMQIEKGESATTYVKWKDCSSIDPEPPAPGNNVYSSFLTLYVDKITYLAEGFTTNPYLIAMIGIIFSWVVLEITLKIINIRRKK